MNLRDLSNKGEYTTLNTYRKDINVKTVTLG